MNLIYRRAVPEDAAACVDLRGKTRENPFSVEQLRAIGVTLESWREGIRNDTLPGYVCLSGSEIVGYCFGDKATGEIAVLAVLPDYENKGIGKSLLNEMVQHFKGLGFRRLFLGCSSDPRARSYGFYRHLGWRSTGILNAAQDEVLEYFLSHEARSQNEVGNIDDPSGDLTPPARQPSHGKLVTVLMGAAVLANLAILPYSVELMPEDTQELLWVSLTFGLVFQLAILYGCIEVGLHLGPPIGIKTPLLFGLLGGERLEKPALRKILGVALGGGAAVGLILWGLSELLVPHFPKPRIPVPQLRPFAGFLASIGAGISEEIMFRFGCMTLIALLGVRLFRQENSPAPMIWTANVLAALLFGIAHLPQTVMFFDFTATVLFAVLALNGVLGVFCGWLLWRYGLVSAMLAHFSADIVLKVLVPLIQ
jgi:ribosomal protein S18 acetylase RimI-like enzyme/membrane protease YdiL (CAAX protease family)